MYQKFIKPLQTEQSFISFRHEYLNPLTAGPTCPGEPGLPFSPLLPCNDIDPSFKNKLLTKDYMDIHNSTLPVN